MRKYSVNTHRIPSPQISNTISLDNIFEVFNKLSVGESSSWCLHDLWFTTKRYLILSTGAINVLLSAPAMPPEIKLFVILNYSLSYLMVIEWWYYESEI